jgi:hypothetical protein
MSESGQTRSSGRFRYTSAHVPQADLQAALHDIGVVPLAEVRALFDHLVGGQQKFAGNCQLQFSCGFQIHEKFELCWLLDW